MDGIKCVRTTGLFWETLQDDNRRCHKRYPAMRAAIEELVIHKAGSRTPFGKRDSRFSSTSKQLAGIWHCSLSYEPDTVVFYTMEQDTITLAMIGSHADYPHQGDNHGMSARTGLRIRNAVASGHQHSPQWRSIQWRKPSDLIGHPELAEASFGLLNELSLTMQQEAHDGAIFRSLHGHDVTEADPAIFDAWFSDVEAAQAAILETMKLRPVTGEERVAKLVAEGSSWARAV